MLLAVIKSTPMKMLPDNLPDDAETLKQLLLEREAHWQGQYQALLEQWRLARHKRFGASSESSPGQGELFNEAEQEAESVQDEETAEETVTYTRRKARRPRLPDNLPRERVVVDIEDTEQKKKINLTHFVRPLLSVLNRLKLVPFRTDPVSIAPRRG